MVIDDQERVGDILKDSPFFSNCDLKRIKKLDEAFREICFRKPDLIVADSEMLSSEGFLLVEKVRNLYPQIKFVLTASDEIDQRFPFLRRYNIGNVLLKGPDISDEEIAGYIQSVLTGSFFGLHHLFPETEIKSIAINTYAQAREICSEITGACHHNKSVFLEIAIDELISNAFFHAVLNLSGLSRECWYSYSEVQPDCAIRVTWARDEEKIGVSVEDPQGNLKKRDVLKWLDTCREEKDEEEHGRGFLLVRRLLDRMIINIDPGNRTECVVVQYFHKKRCLNKPLMINELEAENSLNREKLPL